MDKEDIVPSVEPATDKIHRIVKVGLSSVPHIGGAAAELFATLISPPLEKRRTRWMNQAHDAIIELQEKNNVNVVDLFENEEFISLFSELSISAIRTHEQARKDAMLCALKNSVLMPDLAYTKKDAFVNILGDTNVTELQMLIALKKSHGGDFLHRHSVLKPWQNDSGLRDYLIANLAVKGLVEIQPIDYSAGRSTPYKKITAFGEEFIVYTGINTLV